MVDKLDYDLIKPQNSSLPYIVFIHGAGGDKSQWDFQTDFLSKKGYGTLTISLPDHGKSKTESDFLTRNSRKPNLIPHYTQKISDLISNLDIEKYCLVGHSMGGGIILNFSLMLEKGIILDLPPLPEMIFLIGTGAKLNVAPVFFDLLKTDFNEALRLMSKFSYGTKADLSIKLDNQKILTNNGMNVLFNDLEACKHFDVRESLNKIKIPAIIICGDEDQMTPPKFSHYLHENLANSQIFLIQEAGHFVFQEVPTQVNDIIYRNLTSGIDNYDR